MLPALALPSFASLFNASAIGGAVATGVRAVSTKSTSKGSNYSLAEIVDIGTDFVSTTQSTVSSGLSTEFQTFTNLLNTSTTAYQAVLPAINSVSKGLIESSTINSGLVNTIATASNRNAEITKELSNGLTTLNNTLTSMFQLQANKIASELSFTTMIKQNIEGIALALTQIASLPKVVAESGEHSLGLLYDIHGALDYQARLSAESSLVLSEIRTILNSRTVNQSATNTKIVEGITSQTTTNTKTNEHYDYQKEKNVTASDGTQYSPREIQAKANAEHHLDKKDSNQFDWSLGFLDFLDDPLFEDDDMSLLNLLELLKTTPLELIDSIDDGRSILRKES